MAKLIYQINEVLTLIGRHFSCWYLCGFDPFFMFYNVRLIFVCGWFKSIYDKMDEV